MSSLFTIEVELASLIDELVEAGGEVTPEQEEQLKILECDFKEKLLAYGNFVKSLEGDIDTAKTEADRISAYIKSKKLKVERLQKSMKDALLEFGTANKNGSYEVEVDANRIIAQKSTVCILDDDKINIIFKDVLNSLSAYIDEVDEIEEIDSVYFIDQLILQDQADEVMHIGYKEGDFNNINVNISINMPLTRFITNGFKQRLIDEIVGNNSDYKVSVSANKSDVSKELKAENEVTIGKLENNYTIKLK